MIRGPSYYDLSYMLLNIRGYWALGVLPCSSGWHSMECSKSAAKPVKRCRVQGLLECCKDGLGFRGLGVWV